jgi:hypothetical protein
VLKRPMQNRRSAIKGASGFAFMPDPKPPHKYVGYAELPLAMPRRREKRIHGVEGLSQFSSQPNKPKPPLTSAVLWGFEPVSP